VTAIFIIARASYSKRQEKDRLVTPAVLGLCQLITDEKFNTYFMNSVKVTLFDLIVLLHKNCCLLSDRRHCVDWYVNIPWMAVFGTSWMVYLKILHKSKCKYLQVQTGWGGNCLAQRRQKCAVENLLTLLTFVWVKRPFFRKNRGGFFSVKRHVYLYEDAHLL